MGPEGSDPRFMRYQIKSTQAEVAERKGVLHIVQGWIQQKQPAKVSLTHVPVCLQLKSFLLKGSFSIVGIHS
jgi:hypothetical protein